MNKLIEIENKYKIISNDLCRLSYLVDNNIFTITEYCNENELYDALNYVFNNISKFIHHFGSPCPLKNLGIQMISKLIGPFGPPCPRKNVCVEMS